MYGSRGLSSPDERPSSSIGSAKKHTEKGGARDPGWPGRWIRFLETLPDITGWPLAVAFRPRTERGQNDSQSQRLASFARFCWWRLHELAALMSLRPAVVTTVLCWRVVDPAFSAPAPARKTLTMNHTTNPPTPCLWQAPASTQKTKRKTRSAIRRSARWRVSWASRLPRRSPTAARHRLGHGRGAAQLASCR